MLAAVVQTNPVFGKPKENIQQALALMETMHADLYVLPELFSTGYNFVDEGEAQSFAELPEGATFQLMQEWLKHRKSYVVYGFSEKAGAIYNSSVLAGPEGLIGLYRKVHLFDRENLFFAPGNLGFPVFDLPWGRVGIMVCFDWIYPESARSLALKGAQFIAHPSNLVLPYCPNGMVTRCLENKVFAATADRVGEENRGGIDLRFIGSSGIVSPNGSILHRLGTTEPSIAAVDIDLSDANQKKINKFNDVLQGRRLDQYRL